MCIGMANGGKSLTEDLRNKSAADAIKSFQEAGTKFTNDMYASGADIVYEMVRKFSAEVVEEQDNIIMQTVQQIGGEEYSHITIDKNKVLDAFKKQMPRKPKFEDEKDYWGNIVGGRYRCSECDRFICHAEELRPEEYYPYCHCGQKIDWSDTE